ncbi:MAG TPA: hypothetical protein VEF04_19700, partial [Blastocatellia bacterium]|nr:hypothetical protein [Blastocatellia bacterium]
KREQETPTKPQERRSKAPQLPPEIEEYRDHTWQRDPMQRIETAAQAERFIERVGFTATLTDSSQPGPSLYVAVCGRRDAEMPRNVQKDPEASLSWTLKDEVVQRGRVYYGKLARGKAMFLAPRMIPHFYAIWGVRKREEKMLLSKAAQAILKVLRKEWESATIDLRNDSGVSDRKVFNKAMDELQSAMIVIPSEVAYVPKFTYIWTLAEVRFAEALNERVDIETARREIARCFLESAGMTVPGELAKVTGMSRPEAGLGNRALVKEGFAISPSQGTYLLSDLQERLEQLRS